MKLKIRKDVVLRKKLFFLEKQFTVLKYVIKNICKYPLKEKKRKYLKKVRYLLAKKIKLFNISKTRIVRRCILTGRSRSSIRLLNISRLKIKELIKNKSIKDIKKRSW
jgi:ribosomal protein S14